MTIGQPPIRVWSIHFQFPGADSAIPLKDADTGTFVGETPEWTAFPEGGGAGRNVPAAYPGGVTPVIRVVFQLAGAAALAVGRRATDHASRTFTVRADEVDGGIGVPAQRHEIGFDAQGFSAPLEFRLGAPLPLGIGRQRLTWHWIVEGELEGPATPTIGLTDHDLYTVWRPPLEPSRWEPVDDGDPTVWAWRRIVEWTCDWAAGADGEKAVCDALIAQAHKSGLKYGISAHLPKAMFAKGGGMCSGYYRLFQAMAGCHGIEVLRRSFLVNWPKGTEETRWCALVVTHPGMNRDRPAFDLTLFHDVDRLPSGADPVQPTRRIERRYRFWGDPVQKTHDGHCINYLVCAEGTFLYDSCFLDHAIQVDVVPEPNLESPTPLDALGNFKEAYLDKGVAFMLGSIRNGDRVFRTVLGGMYEGKRRWRNDGMGEQLDLLNGLTVPTSQLAHDQIDFFWGE